MHSLTLEQPARIAPLQAPFPYFGGKSSVASEIWSRFGNPANYVEPFFGSGAVLLARPSIPKVETVNDANGFLCVAPSTNILAADLTWMSAGDIRVGDSLIGFDEDNGSPQSGPARRADRPSFQPPQSMRKWRVATVTNVRRVFKPSYRLTFEDGTTVTCSSDHLWLAGKSKSGGRGARWVRTSGLRCDKSQYRSHVMKLCDVSHRIESADAGWVGGFYDGEGNVQGRGSGWALSVCQKLGPEADRVENWLKSNGFSPVRAVREPLNDKHQPVASISFNGGMRETLRFLMLTRPERLIRNAVERLHTRSIYGRERQVVGLVAKEFLGETEVVAIETDTRTYIAEGLASHNCNFWRALQADPDAVAHHADWPVNEADLAARHYWLVTEGSERLSRVLGDPHGYDAQIAGWWVWGMCSWIGAGWCDGQGPWQWVDGGWQKKSEGDGVNLARPHLRGAGQGVNRKLTHLGGAGRGINRQGAAVAEWFHALAARLRRVRVAHGDWSRVCGPSVTHGQGVTAVFLDPPYSRDVRAAKLYATESATAAAECREWAISVGDDPLMRICLAGYFEEHEMPSGWTVERWKAHGGYGNQGEGAGRANAAKETLWFSPHCLNPQQGLLF